MKHGNTIPYMHEITLSCLDNGVVGTFSLGRDGGSSFNATGDWTGVRMSFFVPIIE